MPSSKTECTELSVGFGLLEIDPVSTLRERILVSWADSLSPSKLSDYLTEYSRDEAYYRRFLEIGNKLRRLHGVFERANIDSVRWEGPHHQARSVSMAKDLVAANIPISVKANSNVVFNHSPYVLFTSVPRGVSAPTRSDNWFSTVAYQSYQDLYTWIRSQSSENLPTQVDDYHRTVKGNRRKLLSRAVNQLTDAQRIHFDALYLKLCQDVAGESADRFNTAIQSSFSGPIRNAVAEETVKTLFRLGDSEYVLCGLDHNNGFGVNVPDITSWKRQWMLRSVVAQPDFSRGQSIVDINLVIENRQGHQQHKFDFEVQIRWAHGKFSGNPEAKVYKKFPWIAVPFFHRVYGE